MGGTELAVPYGQNSAAWAQCLLPPGLQTGLASPSQSRRHFLGPHPNCPQKQAGRILESGHTTRLQEFMLFLLLTDPPGAYVPDGVGGTPGRESGGLGFRPIWASTTLYNLDLRGVPVGQVRSHQWGSKGPVRSKMHSFNRYLLSSYYVPGPGLRPGDIAMNQAGKSLPSWCCQRREGRPISRQVDMINV